MLALRPTPYLEDQVIQIRCFALLGWLPYLKSLTNPTVGFRSSLLLTVCFLLGFHVCFPGHSLKSYPELKGFQPRKACRDEEGNLIGDTMSVAETWKDYFEKLLNTNQCAEEQRELVRGIFQGLEDGKEEGYIESLQIYCFLGNFLFLFLNVKTFTHNRTLQWRFPFFELMQSVLPSALTCMYRRCQRNSCKV